MNKICKANRFCRLFGLSEVTAKTRNEIFEHILNLQVLTLIFRV